MFGKEKIDPENITKEFSKILNVLSEDDFFRFFFHHDSMEVERVSGYVDFSVHIESKVNPYLKARDRVLEIGCGAGRVLMAAAGHFSHAYGADIHERGDLVLKRGRAQGRENIDYLHTNGMSLPAHVSAIDLIYSIYAFTYAGNFLNVEGTIYSAYKSLKPEGIAIFYYGSRSNLCSDTDSMLRLSADFLLESVPGLLRIVEATSEVNQRNLSIPRRIMHQTMTRHGFKILAQGRSVRLGPPFRYGGQNYIIGEKSA